MFLMDTSFVIELFRNPSKVEKFLTEVDEEGATTSAITVYEIFRKRSGMNRREVAVFMRFFRTFGVLPFDSFSAEKAAEVYEKLERVGEKINENYSGNNAPQRDR